ncbi:GNAT family N-acetyltransferase [Flindersiella endophytica]
MRLDDVLVFDAELRGLRLLGSLSRPKVPVRVEDVPGAMCLWGPPAANGGHRYEVRLVPGSGVPLVEVLRAIRASKVRPPGGHLYLRGVAASFDAGTVAWLRERAAGRETTGPHAMMAYDLRSIDASAELPEGLTASVARTAEDLARLRSVARQVYVGQGEADADAGEDNVDFFHAPGTMTYLAVGQNGQTVSTGSILLVDGVANVWTVATLPAARGQGAASAIVRAACAEARLQGAWAAVLRTSDDLARENGLYYNVGFRFVGHEHAWNLDSVDELDL